MLLSLSGPGHEDLVLATLGKIKVIAEEAGIPVIEIIMINYELPSLPKW